MKSFAILLFCFLGFNSQAMALTQINDPSDILGATAQYLNADDFDKSANCSSHATFTQHVESCSVGCTDKVCFTSCQSPAGQEASIDYTQYLVNCTQDEFTLANDLGTLVVFTRQEFSRVKGSLAQVFLENLEEFILHQGSVRIISAQPGQFKINAGTPEEKTLNVYSIEAEFTYKDYPTQAKLLLTVSKEMPLAAQLLRFRFNTNTWFRFKSL